MYISGRIQRYKIDVAMNIWLSHVRHASEHVQYLMFQVYRLHNSILLCHVSFARPNIVIVVLSLLLPAVGGGTVGARSSNRASCCHCCQSLCEEEEEEDQL